MSSAELSPAELTLIAKRNRVTGVIFTDSYLLVGMGNDGQCSSSVTTTQGIGQNSLSQLYC